ncbi:unnamed protein product [Agarophyton chilense]|eukprot:gb/GEZJ01003702.1/.p1 GENE.gb/GEZJ01003702.1/~~gb/GEZJ01003702.1/.p1  ORF type:complete len:432 (-),score=35.39 gb/GEZJ01003702.1/:122-1417(-)
MSSSYDTFALRPTAIAIQPLRPPPTHAAQSAVLLFWAIMFSFQASPSTVIPPAWRQRIVQFDVSYNAIALAFFAFTGSLRIASRIGVPDMAASTMFFASLMVLALCSLLTVMRAAIFPDALVRDFSDPRLINFFFLPAIIVPLALITAPPHLRHYHVFMILFYISFIYQFCLSLYTYGQWLQVSTPVSTVSPLLFMQTIAYFVLSICASYLNLPDMALFLLVPGVLFWLLIFVTVFQHTTPALQKWKLKPNPVFCLFLAPPAQATIAILFMQTAKQASQLGSSASFLELPSSFPRDAHADIALYLDLFIYFLLLRIFHTWLHQPFGIVWWACVFPLSGASSAIILRCEGQQDVFWRVLASASLAVATISFLVITVLTLKAIRKGEFPKNSSLRESYLQHYAQYVKETTRFPLALSTSFPLPSVSSSEENYV